MLIRMIDAGFLSQMILSHDAWCFAESYGHSGDYNLIHDTMLPMLRGRGFDQSMIDAPLVDNPRRLFSH